MLPAVAICRACAPEKALVEIARSPHCLRGQIRVTEAAFEEPELRLRRSSAGTLALPRTDERLQEGLGFERISLRRAHLIVETQDGDSLRVDDFDLDAEATSLIGPYKGSGTWRRKEGAVAFRFGTGLIENEKLRLKLVADETAASPRVDLDGAVSLGYATPFAYAGQATFSANRASAPWRISGKLDFDRRRALMEPADLRWGPDEQPLTASGTAQFDLATSKLELAFRARQIDIDRLWKGDDAETAPTPRPAIHSGRHRGFGTRTPASP